MIAEELTQHLKNVRRTTRGWEACCPAHDDHNASLGIAEGEDGRVLVKCHAGCKFHAIVAAMGLKPSDMFPSKPHVPRQVCNGGEPIKTYDYTDPDGKLLFQVCRFEPKDFRQRRPDPDKPDAWQWNMNGVERVLYRLPDVLKAKRECRVLYVCEGEKDADALATLGLSATCNSGGAGKWQDSYTKTLTGAKVVILADKDSPGRKHAALVLQSLTGKAESVHVIELPDREGHKVKDAADWISSGGTITEWDETVEHAPKWMAPIDAQTETSGTALVPAGDVAGIRARLWAILQTKKLSATEQNREISAAVVAWLHGRGRFYFHVEKLEFAGVMYFDTRRKLLLPVQGDAFLAWLADCLAMNRAERSFSFVQSACETEGLSDRATGIEPATFWAATAEAFYLSNGSGSMARITAAAVELVDNGTDGILFPYGATLAPWAVTEPVDPFEVCALFRDVSASAPHGRLLFILWAVSLPTNQRTKPPLVLSGTVGSGKTRLVRGVSELYGIPPRIAAVLKHGEGDFWAAMDAGGLACFDNADTRVDWLADALAAAATAGILEKRQLYTDADRVSLKARSWVCVTSSSPSFAADPGLADRVLVVRLERRTGETAETTLSDEIAVHRDAGLSWICQTLHRALADREAVPTGLNARHPDFATLAVRIGRAIGREAEAIAALRAAEADKGLFNVENDWIGGALLELLRAGPFTGTAGDLLAALVEIDPSFNDRLSAKSVGKRLSKLWPHLESVFDATKDSDGHTKEITYRMKTPGTAAECAGFEAPF